MQNYGWKTMLALTHALLDQGGDQRFFASWL